MQLAGVEEPDASGGLEMGKVAREWTDALRQHDHWTQLLREGPSDLWGESKHSDIVALQDEAAATLLSLSAPHLIAVITKLEILWADQRFDPGHETVDHLLILQDLRRFVLGLQR